LGVQVLPVVSSQVTIAESTSMVEAVNPRCSIAAE
jgi:hypothetical protein